VKKKSKKKFSKKQTKKRPDRGRYSAKRKTEAVLRLLRGENLDSLSRELGVTAGTLSEWKEQFLAAGESGLKSRKVDPADDEIMRLKAKVGELMMDNELYEEMFEMKGIDSPFPGRRSRS
jgi:hypothetical protein